jgi:hypothetical protein
MINFVMNLSSDEAKYNFLFIQLFLIDIYETYRIRHLGIKNF